MTTMYGTVRHILERPAGAAIAADAASSATEIEVDDASIFLESGGHVLIDDVVYAYDSADHEADTLTLSTGLLAAVEEGETVILYDNDTASIFPDYIAVVELEPAGGSNDDPVEALIRHGLVAYLIESDGGDMVRLETVPGSKGARLIVDDIIRQTPFVDGSFIDPETVPEPPSSDGLAPASAPTVTARPLGYSGIIIQWTAVSNEDPTRYRVFADTVNPPVQELTETAGLFATTSRLADDTSLDPTTTVYVRVQAYDEDGDGPLSDVVSTTPLVVPADVVAEDIIVVNDLYARDAFLGSVSADQIETGELLAALAIIGGLMVGPGITIDPDNGIIIATPNGDTQFPTDGSDIKLSAEVIATALTVLGGFSMRGEGEIATGARLVVQAGVTPPSAKPTMSSRLKEKPAHPGYVQRGFTPHPSEVDHWLTIETLFGAVIQVTENTASDPEAGSYAWTSGWSISGVSGSNRSEVTGGRGGVAVIGSHAYVLCETNETIPGTFDSEWYVYKFLDDGDGTWTYVTRWIYRPGNAGGGGGDIGTVLGGRSPYKPQICSDGTNLVIVQPRNSGGAVYVSRYSTTGAFVDLRLIDDGIEPWTSERDVRGLTFVPASDGDAPEDRYYVTFAGLGACYPVLADDAEVQLVDQFRIASSDSVGIHWDGTRFRERTADAVHTYSLVNDSTLPTSAVNARFTVRKADATGPDFAEFETTPSPAAASSSLRNRWWIHVSTPPSPSPADSVSIYLARGSDPATTAYRLAATPAVDVYETDIDEIPTSTGAPPTSSNFGSATPGVVEAGVSDGEGPLWELDGSGPGRVGPWSWDENGNDLTDSDWVTFTPSAGEAPFAAAGVTTAKYRQVGKKVTLILVKDSTAARDLSANTTGNFTNVNIVGGVGSAPTPSTAYNGSTVMGYGRIADSPVTAVMHNDGRIIWVGGYPRNYASGSTADLEFQFFVD